MLPVIGQIEVALPFWDNITSPETEQTSRWCSNSRTFAEPINEAIANDDGASCWCSFTHGWWIYPSPCELAANPYRVGLILQWNEAASSGLFRGRY
jgi:hypothetical protein